MVTASFPLSVGRRPRAFLRVSGRDAEDLLHRLVSNDVQALRPGEACDALLLTAKGRVIAPLRIARVEEDAFLVLTEPELGDRLQEELLRFRLASRAEIVREEHDSHVLLGRDLPGGLALPTREYGVAGWEVVDGPAPEGARELGDEELERLRILAGTPRVGRELDERVLPAEAGLDATHVSFSKGCFPGQEPVARLHYRGHPNRRLRRLTVEGTAGVPYDADVLHGERVIGRVTSAVPDGDGATAALGYVRREVPDDAELFVLGRAARLVGSA
jgi:folate-binding protein YgfZ